MQRHASLLVALVVLLAAVGFAPAAVAGHPDHGGDQDANQCEFPVTLTDATGTEVTIDERPDRITTTNPSAAQVMWEIGGEDQVVGLTQYALYLEGAEERQNVSATDFGVSVERVVGTEPDLVLAPNATDVETVEALREAGITVFYFEEATDFDAVAEKTTLIGRLTGNCEGAAETNAWMEANVDVIAEATADVERPRLMYPLGGDWVVGGNTFIHEMIVASGAENIAAEEFDGYQPMSAEAVIELDPEVLILTENTEYIVDEDPYASTTAVQQNNTVFLDVNFLNQPAPRSVVYTTRNLTAELHPEAYDESDYVTREEAAATIEAEADAEADAGAEGEGDGENDSGATAEAEAEGGDESSVSAPGFGAVAAALALLGAALLARRD